MIVLNENQIKWLTRHTVDPIGEVFEWNNTIYRIIHKEQETWVKRLLGDQFIRKCISEKLLVHTEICDDICLEGDNRKLILKQKKCHFPILQYEWTEQMFLEAKMMMEKLLNILSRGGYALSDPHYENICFDGCIPIYVDFGSICELERNEVDLWDRYEAMWITPFELYKKKYITKQIWENIVFENQEIIKQDEWQIKRRTNNSYAAIIKCRSHLLGDVTNNPNRMYRFLSKIFKIMTHFDSRRYYERKIERATRRTSKYINLREKSKLHDMGWGDYHDVLIEDKQLVENERMQYYCDKVAWLAKHDKCTDVLEIAGNAGVLSELLISNNDVGCVCCIDYDENAINKGFLRCKDKGELNNKITFAKKNVLSLNENIRKLPYERLGADIVIALAVTHHLILTQKVKLDIIVDLLYSYSKRYVIVEFMPLGLWSEGTTDIKVPSWYNLDWFIDGMKKKFDIKDIKQIHKNRIAVIARRL